MVQVYRHTFTFSTVVMDRLLFLAGRTEDRKSNLHGVEAFDLLAKAKQGFVLASRRLGSFEVLRVLAVGQQSVFRSRY